MLRESENWKLALVTKVAHLKQAQYLGQMGMEQLRHLATCGTERWFEANAPLIEQEQSLDSLLVILQGEVGVTVDVGAERTVWFYVAGPGSLVDPCVLLDPPAASFSTCALSLVEALEIPRACLLNEINEKPAVGYAMMQQLSERLNLIARVLAKQGENQAPRFSCN